MEATASAANHGPILDVEARHELREEDSRPEGASPNSGEADGKLWHQLIHKIKKNAEQDQDIKVRHNESHASKKMEKELKKKIVKPTLTEDEVEVTFQKKKFVVRVVNDSKW